jgi:RHS repeat-associated protein
VYYLADGLGSTMATTDASGNVVNTYTYHPYGATSSSTGSQPNPFQFAGQQTDPTGLQYLRARYYDPATGTFLSSDPLGLSPSWPGSPYVYANGNPALLIDPYGLFCVGPLCVSSHDVTLGGHSAKQGVDSLAGGAIGTLRSESTLITIAQIASTVAAASACPLAIASDGLLLPACVAAVVIVGATTEHKAASVGTKFANHSIGPVAAACQLATAGPGPWRLPPLASTVLCKTASFMDGLFGLSPSNAIGEKQP